MISNCAVFRNNENNNNFGVILPNGNIVLKEIFSDIMYFIYYGIIDKNMRIVLNPLSKEYFGYEG